MKKLSIIAFAFLFVAAFVSVSSVSHAAMGKAAFVDKMIGVYGGEANLKKLDSYTAMWKMEVRTRPIKGKAIVSVDQRGQAGKLRVDLIYPNSSEIRVVNGSKGYKGYGTDPMQEVSGPKLTSMKLQLMRLYTPLTLKAKLNSIVQMSETGPFTAIVLKEGGLVVIYYVNTKSYIIEMVVGRLKMGPREMEFKTEYSDFKKVDGVLMHHRENKFAAGMNTAELFLGQIKLGVTHPEKIFNK